MITISSNVSAEILEVSSTPGIIITVDPPTAVDVIIVSTGDFELLSNKQDSLAIDGTGTKYPTVDAVNIGLQSVSVGTGTINYIPKRTSATGLGDSAISQSITGERVLLGTIDNLTDKLQVNGSALFNGNVKTLGQFRTTSQEGLRLSADGAFISFYGYDDATWNGFLQSSVTAITLSAIGSGKQMELNTFGGNVLVGTTTDNGTDKLQVNGGGHFAGRLDVFKSGAAVQVASFRNDNSYLSFESVTDHNRIVSLDSTQVATKAFAICGYGASPMLMIRNNGNTLINTATDNGVDKLQVNGSVKATQFKLSALNTAPASATDTGTTGEIRVVNGFIYVCVATNTWQRTALSTW